MTTITQLVEQTKAHLLASHREPINKLVASVDDTTTEIPLLYTLGAVAEGAVIEVDLEQMYVWETDPGNKRATVQRGHNGTLSVGHDTDKIVTVNPKFPAQRILDACQEVLYELSGMYGVYRVVPVEFTYIAGQEGYEIGGDLDTAPLYGLEVRYDVPGVSQRWPEMSLWLLKHQADVGLQLVLQEGGYPGRDVRFLMAMPFAPLSIALDVEAATGLEVYQTGLLPLGAALRLQSTREGQRNFNEAQPETRRSAEVPVGAQLQSSAGLRDLFINKCKSERLRLERMHPHRRKVAL